jgi:hypothetical protein
VATPKRGGENRSRGSRANLADEFPLSTQHNFLSVPLQRPKFIFSGPVFPACMKLHLLSHQYVPDYSLQRPCNGHGEAFEAPRTLRYALPSAPRERKGTLLGCSPGSRCCLFIVVKLVGKVRRNTPRYTFLFLQHRLLYHCYNHHPSLIPSTNPSHT